jgi:hypothetical protein
MGGAGSVMPDATPGARAWHLVPRGRGWERHPGRAQGLRKWRCYLGRHDYVQDRWDRPRGGPPPKTQTCLRCGKKRDPDALMGGAPWVGGP